MVADLPAKLLDTASYIVIGTYGVGHAGDVTQGVRDGSPRPTARLRQAPMARRVATAWARTRSATSPTRASTRSAWLSV